MKDVNGWCVGNFRYDVFSKYILFILGFVFSYKLVEKLFFNILITHLTDEREDYDLREAAIVMNSLEGIGSVAVIIFAFIADAYSGLFTMVVGSTTLCIVGLLLTSLAASDGGGSVDVWAFYPTLMFMTLSQAASMITLKAFLGDQLVRGNPPATPKEKERAQRGSMFWWTCVSFLASIFALFGPLRNFSLIELSFVLAIAMGATFLLFLLGFKFYNYNDPTGSQLENVISVICSAIPKRNFEYAETPEQLHQNTSVSVRISPDVSWLRRLDKAAVEQQGPAIRNYSVEEVMEVKFLLKMLPMWTTFLTFSLVAASGSTFFLEEATSITDDTFPILFFINVQRFTEFIVSGISNILLEKLNENNNKNAQRMMLVRIGIGMVCCVVCCIAARENALDMLHLVRTHGDANNRMSVYRLTPQYLLLGLMEGLSAEGLENFFDSQVSRSMSSYGQPFRECAMGIGKFLSVALILASMRWSKWFPNETKPRRLDKYYMLLAGLSSANIILYCFVAYLYGDETFPSGNATGDIEMVYLGLVDQPVDSVESMVHRSLPSQGPYNSHQLLSRRIASKPEDQSSFGDNPTGNTNSGQSQTHEEPIPSSSTVSQADNEENDHETDTLLTQKLKKSKIYALTAFSSLYSKVKRSESRLKKV